MKITPVKEKEIIRRVKKGTREKELKKATKSRVD